MVGSVEKNSNGKCVDSAMPAINLEDKRKILNQLGLKNINKMKNVHALMGKINQ